MSGVNARYLVHYFHLHLYDLVLVFALPTATRSPWGKVPFLMICYFGLEFHVVLACCSHRVV
jgi:hypothetical protein